jgi:multiple sugar transport system ATP-binding protein
MADLELQNVKKSYGNVDIIHGLNLAIEKGEFVVFVGPSGCGKSTLLRMIAGLEEVTSGAIRIGGKDVTHAEPADRGIAMVFQSYALYPHMTVGENIGFSLSLARRPKAEIAEAVGKAARILQLDQLLDRKPKALSGGQRQRVAIGRAIVRDPQVFLFDEPLSNLDAALRTQMRLELTDLHTQIGATMVYVTHDQVEAMTMADKIVVLNKGHVEQVGTPMELYRNPATPFVAAFIGSPKMNLFEGEFATRNGCDLFGVRPEHIDLGKADGAWKGRVHHMERLGSDAIIDLDADGVGPRTVRTDGETDVCIGYTVFASPRAWRENRFRAGARV